MIPADEIVAADHSGGANTSHTIVIPHLTTLLAAVERGASAEAYERAVVDDNVLGKETIASRRRTFRYLRELYLLRPDSVLFRALRDLWNEDHAGRPLLAGLCALARDPSFRASSGAVLGRMVGEELSNRDLAEAVRVVYPSAYSDAVLAKVGRNTFSSWEQTGHLAAVRPGAKWRVRAVCTPAAVAFALFLGHLEGAEGEDLFDTSWIRLCDSPLAAGVPRRLGEADRVLLPAGVVIEMSGRSVPLDGEIAPDHTSSDQQPRLTRLLTRR